MTANVADLVAAAAQRVPARTALVDGASGEARSWAELDAEVRGLAAAYQRAGLAEGDRVVVSASTTIPACVAVFALLRCGAVLVPVAEDAPAPATEHVINDSGARFAVGVAGLPALPTDGVEEDAPVRGAGEDLAVLCYTSGTMAGPTGVMLSHRALLANLEQCGRIRPAPVVQTDRVLVALPLFHIYGLSAALLQAAAAGATAVLIEHFHPEDVLTALSAHRVSTMPGVPSMFAALLAAGPERLADAMSTVRLLTSGAAPLPDKIRVGVRAATGLQIFEGYGLTEAAPVVTWSLVSGMSKPASVGKAIPGVELKLTDSDGAELPEPDESGDESGVGRVALRGPNLFSGYWPDGRRGPDADGWFVTGDIGYLDVDGDLHLVDRAGDLIIVNGFNVFPHEVEEVLSTMDGVAEVAVVGVPDERSGEAVKAVLRLSEGTTVAEADIRDHCARRLARFKVPSIVQFTDALPHSATGKLSRRKLRT